MPHGGLVRSPALATVELAKLFRRYYCLWLRRRPRFDAPNPAITPESDRFIQATAMPSGLPFYIDETPTLTPQELRGRAWQMVRQFGVGLLVVYYSSSCTLLTRRPVASSRWVRSTGD